MTYAPQQPLLEGGPWRDLDVEQPADGRAWGVAVGAALLADLAVRSGGLGLAGALLVAAVAAGLLISGRVPSREARLCLLAAPVFGLGLFVRSSPWVVPLDVVAAGGLLVLGCSLARGGRVLDLSLPAALARVVHALGHGIAAPVFLLARLPGWSGTTARVVRGLLLGAPVLLLLGLLLASADAVFASFFSIDLGDGFAHIAVVLAAAWAMAGLLRLASAKPLGPLPAPIRPLGAVEATVVLGALVALFSAFAIAQVVAISEGGRRVIETAGLTYAEYARSGFFQLLAVAGVTLAVLLALRGATDLADPTAQRRFAILGVAATALTLVVVAVALRRLALYKDVFGATMLRLYASLAVAWIGVVFVMLAAALLGVGKGRHWLVPAAGGAALAIVLALTVVNPEAAVVRYNVDHAESTGRFDPEYLAELSDDAVPALVDALPRLAPEARAEVLARICDPIAGTGNFRGWAAYNPSVDAAAEARNRVCP
jgi:hypothetical protein